jgi:hypothetical protein
MILIFSLDPIGPRARSSIQLYGSHMNSTLECFLAL